MNRDLNGYRPPILITGAARSGTSIVAGTVDTCGAFGGALRPPTRSNKKGMFENVAIVNSVMKAYLKRIKCDPLGQKPLPNTDSLKDYPGLGRDMLKIITEEGLCKDQPWYYKGAKICLIWPIFLKAFPEAKWIVVRRDPADIVASCLRTGFMSAYRTAEGWRGWVESHEKRFDEMREAGVQMMEVWPGKAMSGDTEELKSAIEWAGLKWDAAGVGEFLEPDLWRGQTDGC